MADRIRNVSGHAYCAACIDGWVELRDGRGQAPCQWCEEGLARWQRHPELAADFDGADIVPPAKRGPVFRPDTAFLLEREAAGESIPAMQLIFPPAIWPEHWPAPPPPQRLDDLQPVGAESPPDVDAEPIPADRTPQEAASAPRADDPDLGHAENMLPDDVEVPY